MILSTEQESNEYLCVNSCGIQKLGISDISALRPNGRVDYHILYLMDGSCYTPVDGQMIRVEKGDLILFEPHEPQEYHFRSGEDSVSCYIHFAGTGCNSLLQELGLLGRRISKVGLSGSIGECFQRMEYELLLRRPFYDKRCAAQLLELLTAFGRGLKANEPEVKFDRRIDEVCQQMILDCGEWHDVRYYAEKCCLSLSRFHHLFRQTMGCAPNEYLMRLRIEQAASLLVRTDMGVTDVAEVLGFKEMNYFSRAFKKRLGKPPLQYRECLI